MSGVKLLTEEQLEELRQKNPRGILHLVGKNNRWECVFRSPQAKEYKRFKGMASNSTQQPEANYVLANAIVIYPSREEFALLLEDYPAIPEAMGASEEFHEMVGLKVTEDSKS